VADQVLEIYPMATKALINLFTAMANVDKEVNELNSRPECQRRLLTTESVARGITEISQNDSIAKKCQLPALVIGGMTSAMPMLWPPAPVNFGLEYSLQIAAAMRGPATGRRVGKLYLPAGATDFVGRQAHDLTYTSCQESGLEKRFSPKLDKLFGRSAYHSTPR
jgi:hypothetical protein